MSSWDRPLEFGSLAGASTSQPPTFEPPAKFDSGVRVASASSMASSISALPPPPPSPSHVYHTGHTSVDHEHQASHHHEKNRNHSHHAHRYDDSVEQQPGMLPREANAASAAVHLVHWQPPPPPPPDSVADGARIDPDWLPPPPPLPANSDWLPPPPPLPANTIEMSSAGPYIDEPQSCTLQCSRENACMFSIVYLLGAGMLVLFVVRSTCLR